MMSTYLALLAFSITFFELFVRARVMVDARSVVTTSRRSLLVMVSPDHTDDAKEAIVRRGSLAVLTATVRMSAKLVVILVVLYALFLGVTTVSPSKARDLAASVMTPAGIVWMTVATLAHAWIRGRIVGRH